MNDVRPSCPSMRDTACIDTNKIFDSCRDKDCLEDVAVFLTDYGRDVIEHSSNVRCCSAELSAADITVDPVPFNNGFYRIDIRIYIKMTFECCVNMSNRQIIEGLAVCDKTTVLYGGECTTSVFRSDPQRDGFCPGCPDPSVKTKNSCGCGSNALPTAVFEAADPVVLGAKIIERRHPHHCPCQSERDIPESIAERFGGFAPQGERRLVVSLGIFSVTRLERPAQYTFSAESCSVPEKECDFSGSEDPCAIFRNMEFPVSEFNNEGCGCGKRKN